MERGQSNESPLLLAAWCVAVALGAIALVTFGMLAPTVQVEVGHALSVAQEVPVSVPSEPVAVPEVAPAVTAPGQPQGRQDNDTVAHPVAVAAPAPAPGPWVPALATAHEPADKVLVNGVWLGGYACWNEHGYPIPQSQSECPLNWGGRPPENPTPVGQPPRLG